MFSPPVLQQVIESTAAAAKERADTRTLTASRDRSVPAPTAAGPAIVSIMFRVECPLRGDA